MKPRKRDGTWRLGVVERIDPQGRIAVRLHVAPAGAYEGVVQHCTADELAVVTPDAANAVLVTTRAEIATRAALVRQLESAIAASAELRAPK